MDRQELKSAVVEIGISDRRFSSERQARTYLLGWLTYSQILADLSWSDAAQ